MVTDDKDLHDEIWEAFFQRRNGYEDSIREVCRRCARRR